MLTDSSLICFKEHMLFLHHGIQNKLSIILENHDIQNKSCFTDLRELMFPSIYNAILYMKWKWLMNIKLTNNQYFLNFLFPFTFFLIHSSVALAIYPLDLLCHAGARTGIHWCSAALATYQQLLLCPAAARTPLSAVAAPLPWP